MKVFAFAALLLFVQQATAQWQVGLTGLHASVARHGYRFAEGPYGGGLSVKHFRSPHLALGLNLRGLPRSQPFGVGTAAVLQLMATLEADYYFTDGLVRPYVGLEGGYYPTLTQFRGGDTRLAVFRPAFGAAPKAGVQLSLTNRVELTAAASYHLIFRPGPASTQLLLEAGLALRLGD